MTLSSHVDHLVIAAESLAQGVAWCESTLGVTPGPGGEHPLMGTHNRLLRIATAGYPRAYLEIIAVDPLAAEPGRVRWFDLDDPLLRKAVREEPRLIHFVASAADATAALRGLASLGIDRGPLLQAERPTAAGTLRWRISVRPDGQRLFYGTLPTVIEWGPVHPCDAMPDCGLALESLVVRHPRTDDLAAAHCAIGMEGVAIEAGPPGLAAIFRTPRGTVTLESHGV